MNLQEYLNKQAFKPALINSPPADGLKYSIVIPAFDEASLLKPLKALYQCQLPQEALEVIIVFNASEKESQKLRQKHQNCFNESQAFLSQLEYRPFATHFIFEEKLPHKHAGVGLARKIGMDEAVRRFLQAEQNDGIIICFDADSSCDPDYLLAVSNHFAKHKKTSACSTYYEHPIRGEEFPSEVYQGILFYELHLRYYRQILAYAGLPYAYHTVGSSMAVRANSYCSQGGMNRRKAGEDFYFLQKFIQAGHFSEMNHSRVIPSPRPSHRVPFGTGKAISEMLNQEREIDFSYAWESAEVLKRTVQEIQEVYTKGTVPNSYFIDFIGEEVYQEKLREIEANSTSEHTFFQRFYKWFDALKCLQFVHFLRDHHFADQPMLQTVPKYLSAIGVKEFENDEESLLIKLRKLDKEGLLG